LKGVVPDIILPDTLSYYDDVGETSLENPLPWDTIPSANYTKLNLVEPYIDALRTNSDARIATNQEFVYINQDIEQTKKLQADKTVSLNEREQIKEREANQARQKSRDQERAARKASGLKIYDITVENADQPGLPPALGETNSVAVASSISIINADQAVIKNPPPSLDPTLNETANILQDYIAILSGNHPLVVE